VALLDLLSGVHLDVGKVEYMLIRPSPWSTKTALPS
jgi:hypothetical protein